MDQDKVSASDSLLHSEQYAVTSSGTKVKEYSTLKSVTSFIIVAEFCERLAYYGFAGSLVLFFQTRLGMSNAEADTQYSIWAGACYLFPLLGGYLADKYLGRYKTIVIFCVIYLGGLVLVVFSALPGEVAHEMIFPAMYIVAIGTGGIKPNVSTMGADQFDDSNPQDRLEKESFFNWFYWSINLGAMISYVGIAYICQYGIAGLGGASWGFFIGYLIPAVAMGIAILIFIGGSPRYRMLPPAGSVLDTTFGIIKQAWERRHLQKTESWLDTASLEFGGSYDAEQVMAVKYVQRLLPFLLVFIPYWAIYSQMSTAFQNQGCQMELKAGSVDIPVSALNLFNTVAILMLIPVFDGVIYPYFKNIGLNGGKGLSMLQKIGIGFFVAMLAVITAGILEIIRKDMAPDAKSYLDGGADDMSPCRNEDDFNPYKFQKYYNDNDEYKPLYCSKISGCSDFDGKYLSLSCIDCDDIPQVAPVSVFWQIPQFLLIGTSEILASVTGLEFFYSQAPTSMRSVCQSLNLLTNAMGAWIVIPLIYLVNVDSDHQWVPDDVNEGYLANFFFLLAGLMVLAMGLLYYFAKDYEYKMPDEEQVSRRKSLRGSFADKYS